MFFYEKYQIINRLAQPMYTPLGQHGTCTCISAYTCAMCHVCGQNIILKSPKCVKVSSNSKKRRLHYWTPHHGLRYVLFGRWSYIVFFRLYVPEGELLQLSIHILFYLLKVYVTFVMVTSDHFGKDFYRLYGLGMKIQKLSAAPPSG